MRRRRLRIVNQPDQGQVVPDDRPFSLAKLQMGAGQVTAQDKQTDLAKLYPNDYRNRKIKRGGGGGGPKGKGGGSERWQKCRQAGKTSRLFENIFAQVIVHHE